MKGLWRPGLKDLRQAKDRLESILKPWAKTRLRIVSALLKQPKLDDQSLARKAGTRTIVVRRLFENWKNSGTISAVHFGRPRDLSQPLLAKLKKALQSGELKALQEVKNWLRKERAIVVSMPTVRRYCRELGYELPEQRDSSQRSRRRIYQWSTAQIEELRAARATLGNRAAALMKIGTEHKLPSEAARESGIQLHRVLRYFLGGRLLRACAHAKRGYVLDEKGVREAFWTWCDGEFERNGNECPSGDLAAQFLSSLKVPVFPRGVYRHLAIWRKARYIRPRIYKRHEN